MTRLASDMIASACDANQLLHMCKQLEPAERSQPEVALQAAQRMLALEGDAERARAWLLPVWELYVQTPESLTDTQRSRLFSTLDGTGSDGIDTQWLERIEQAHLNVRVGGEGAQFVVPAIAAGVVDQDAHAHAAICRVQQFAEIGRAHV